MTSDKSRLLFRWLRENDGAPDTNATNTMITIFEDMVGSRSDYPSSVQEFGGCLRLLDLIPEYRERLLELRVHPVWVRLVMHWNDLEAMYRAGFHEYLNVKLTDIITEGKGGKV